MEIVLVHDAQESPTTRKGWLEMAGFQVTLLRGGKELLDLLPQRRPALVLMDVLIEGINGFEMCREVRRRWPAQEVPILLASHIYRGRAYREMAASLGAQRYLLLPIKRDDLLDAVTSTLDNQPATHAAD
jgi:CheY-like chemotaxis protein